jgi:hypothetical protein
MGHMGHHQATGHVDTKRPSHLVDPIGGFKGHWSKITKVFQNFLVDLNWCSTWRYVNRIFVKTQGRCWSLGLGGTYFKSKSLLRSQQLKSNGDVGVPIRLGSTRRSKGRQGGELQHCCGKGQSRWIGLPHMLLCGLSPSSELENLLSDTILWTSHVYSLIVMFETCTGEGRVHVPSIELQ